MLRGVLGGSVARGEAIGEKLEKREGVPVSIGLAGLAAKMSQVGQFNV
jgi:hypothetical protein